MTALTNAVQQKWHCVTSEDKSQKYHIFLPWFLRMLMLETQPPCCEGAQAAFEGDHMERNQSPQPSALAGILEPAVSTKTSIWVNHLRSGSSYLQVSCLSWSPMEQRQADPTESCPNCWFMSKINDYCFLKSLSYGVVCYTVMNKQSPYLEVFWNSIEKTLEPKQYEKDW